MSRKFKFGLGAVLLFLSAIASAQNQYGNRVVVIPLFGDESTWQGHWRVDTVYNIADIIEEGGSSYIATTSHTASLANMPPDADFWELVAASGANGIQGLQGIKGDQGDLGETGPQGDIGLTGPKGDRGTVGAIGPQGAKGDVGNVGGIGPKGDLGPVGPQGSKGDKGDKGDTGDKGDVGAAGPQGEKGDKGVVGATGPQGERGPTGVGMQGPQGATGATGADGSQFPPDGLTTFETIPDAMKPDEKVISGITYTADNGITITTPDALKPNEMLIRGVSYVAGNSISITTPNAMKPNEKVINFAPAQPRTRDNYQPSLGVNHIISLVGTFPSRSATDPFIAQIIMFGGNFAPRGWALCDGQLLPISANSALFSIIGTQFGGDGRSTFALPDLRGRSAIHPGNGPGLSPVRTGQRLGSSSISLD